MYIYTHMVTRARPEAGHKPTSKLRSIAAVGSLMHQNAIRVMLMDSELRSIAAQTLMI